MLLMLSRKLLQFLPPDSANQVRTVLIRAQASLHRLTFVNFQEPTDGWPVLLQISVLKSGTHLLDQILTGFSRVSPFAPRALYLKAYDHRTGTPSATEEVIRALDNYRPLEIVKAHLPCAPALAQSLQSQKFLTYFIYRDPRDMLVSLAYYGFVEAGQETKLMFQHFSMEERIRRLIVGSDFGSFHFKGIDTFYRKSIGWLDYPFILHLRYEDLIHRRQDMLQQIVDHFLRRVDTLPATRDQLVRSLELNIDSRKSPTFRRGATGDWKTHFTSVHKNLFKECTGDLLMQLGYEKNNDW